MNARKKLAVILALIFLLSFLVYTGFEAEKLIFGPQIYITSPKDGSTLENNGAFSVSGTTKNVSFLSLNGRQIFTDANNNFNENLVLLPGYNIITLSAKGRYGKEISKKLQLYLVKSTENTFKAIETASSTESLGTTTTSTKSPLPTQASSSLKKL
ncbi:MAG: hypothetical protein WCV55_01160 [Candidatus Paceibacterota bacterium]